MTAAKFMTQRKTCHLSSWVVTFIEWTQNRRPRSHNQIFKRYISSRANFIVCIFFFLQTKTKKFVWFRLLLFCRCLLSLGRIHLCVKVSKFVSQTIEAKSIVTTQSWNGIAEIIWQMFQIRKKNTFAAFGISTKFTFN